MDTGEGGVGELAGSVHTICSSIVLPPNRLMEDFATEVVPHGDVGAPNFSDVEVQAGILRRGLMGVAIHDMPHIRAFLLPDGQVTVVDGVCLPPFGYHVVSTYGDCRIERHFRMYNTWKPDWFFEAFAPDRVLRVDFTPSYVQAGSATSSVRTAAGTTLYPASLANGYVEEWLDLSRLARRIAPPPDLPEIVEDLRFTIDAAEPAVAFVRGRRGLR